MVHIGRGLWGTNHPTLGEKVDLVGDAWIVNEMGAGMKNRRIEFSPEVLEDLAEMQRNGQWFDDNHTILQREYPNRFVAVHGGRVLASAETLDDLIAQLQKTDAPRLTSVMIRYVWDENTVVIYSLLRPKFVP